MTYWELLEEATAYSVKVKEKPLTSHDGLCNGNKIAIRKDIPTLKEKGCVLAEELGHYHLTVGNTLDLRNENNVRQERKARVWAYDKQIGLTGIINSFNHGCKNYYEMADYLDVTEEFLHDALDCYKGKYGERVELDNYIVYFEPSIGVLKIF
ncbi:MAG: ImmA/IrrE family metallo-endopeptidase [Anaerocolumna sp.]